MLVAVQEAPAKPLSLDAIICEDESSDKLMATAPVCPSFVPSTVTVATGFFTSSVNTDEAREMELFAPSLSVALTIILVLVAYVPLSWVLASHKAEYGVKVLPFTVLSVKSLAPK